jgi:membrane dipeptidase
VQSYADSIARMVDVVGVDYVGVGTDQMGLTGPSAMPSYSDLPQLAAALSVRFKPDEINRLLGGNYRRVFETCIS